MKISIVVPVYNAQDYIRNCVNSVLKQSFTDWELILVDDGSTDDSAMLCDELASNDSRINALHKYNGGVSSARNLGISHAKGDYVIFIDADDELVDNDSLACLYHEGFDLVCYGYECYDVDGNLKISTEQYNQEGIYSVDDAITLMYKCDYYQFYSVSKLFRRDIINNYNVRFHEDIYFSEDRLFIIEYLCGCKNLVFNNSCSVYKYFLRETGAMNSINKGFNYKTLTGFYATQRMLYNLQKRKTKIYNLYLAKQDVLRSYEITLHQLKKNNINDRILKRDLLKRLITSVGLLTLGGMLCVNYIKKYK